MRRSSLKPVLSFKKRTGCRFCLLWFVVRLLPRAGAAALWDIGSSHFPETDAFRSIHRFFRRRATPNPVAVHPRHAPPLPPPPSSAGALQFLIQKCVALRIFPDRAPPGAEVKAFGIPDGDSAHGTASPREFQAPPPVNGREFTGFGREVPKVTKGRPSKDFPFQPTSRGSPIDAAQKVWNDIT